MSRNKNTIRVSEKAYKHLIGLTSKLSIKLNKKVSIAEAVDMILFKK